MSPEQQEVNADAEGDLAPYAGEARRTSERSFVSKDRQRSEVLAFKFGGSSLLGAERTLNAARLVNEAAASSAVIVIVSAMKGVTDRLLRVAQWLTAGEWQKAAREAEHIVHLHLETLYGLQLPDPDRDRVT